MVTTVYFRHVFKWPAQLLAAGPSGSAMVRKLVDNGAVV
jgi:hypothetical protein